MNVDELLSKKGLKFNDLEPEEQETLHTWMAALNNSQLSVPTLQDYIEKMKDSVSQGLSDIEETPDNWLSLLCLFIPFLGIIRKWYIDQKRVMLTARLRNYMLLGAMLSSPERARKAIEKQISGMSAGKTRV